MEQSNVLLKRMCATRWNEEELSQSLSHLSIVHKKSASPSNAIDSSDHTASASAINIKCDPTKLQKNESSSNGETLLTATCQKCGLFVCFPSGSTRVCCYQCQAPIDVTAAMDEKIARKIQKKQRRKSRQKENKQKKKVLVNQLLAEYKQKAETANTQISSDSSPTSATATATSTVPPLPGTSTTTPPASPPESPNKSIEPEDSPLSNSISPPASPSTVVPVPNIPTPITEIDDSLRACTITNSDSFNSPVREEQIFSTSNKETSSRFPTRHHYQHNNFDTMAYTTPPSFPPPSDNFYDRYNQFRYSNQHTYNSPPYSSSPYSTGSSNSSSTSSSPCSPPRSLRESCFNFTPVFMNGPLIPNYTSGTACPGCTFYVKQFNGSPSNSSFLRLRYNRDNLYLSCNDQGYVWPIQQCYQVGLSVFIQFV